MHVCKEKSGSEEEDTSSGPQTGHAVLGEGCVQVMGVTKRGLFTGGQVRVTMKRELLVEYNYNFLCAEWRRVVL